MCASACIMKNIILTYIYIVYMYTMYTSNRHIHLNQDFSTCIPNKKDTSEFRGFCRWDSDPKIFNNWSTSSKLSATKSSGSFKEVMEQQIWHQPKHRSRLDHVHYQNDHHEHVRHSTSCMNLYKSRTKQQPPKNMQYQGCQLPLSDPL